MNKIDQEIARIQAQLKALEAERARAALDEVERQRTSVARIGHRPATAANPASVTANSPIKDKVGLFRRLFVGRSDVFPVRWENRKVGRSGYAPACANEWVKGICGKRAKPPIKCGECPHQAFIPIEEILVNDRFAIRDIRAVELSRAIMAS